MLKDPVFWIEIAIVGLIILAQIVIFTRNMGAIRKLAQLFPAPNFLSVQQKSKAETEGHEITEVPQLTDDPRFSRGFREIAHMTNTYLLRNKGASQGERLQEIAERKAISQEEAIETNLPLPLYIGLLATFTGVIIGLVKIAFVGVTDAAIQAFIGGVIVGMIGSAIGLALTVRSNQVFKNAKETRDAGLEDYFQFLRTQVIHPESTPNRGTIDGLRDSLSAFHEGFTQYQDNMNHSLGETLRLFSELKEVFKQIRSVEQELTGIGRAMRNNDDLLRKQAAYLESYSDRAETFTRTLQAHFEKVDTQVGALVDENINTLSRSTETAYMKMDQYLAALEGSDRLAYARKVTDDLNKVRQDIQSVQEMSLEINAQLVDRLQREEHARVQMAQTLETVSKRLASPPNSFSNSAAGQIFIYTGIVAFLTAIAGGGFYLYQMLAG